MADRSSRSKRVRFHEVVERVAQELIGTDYQLPKL
jgi:hypothetical protein